MKKIKFYLAAVLIAGLSFTSCSDDDDNGSSTSGDIAAKWSPIKTITTVANNEVEQTYENQLDACGDDYIEFATANVFNRGLWTRNADTNACEISLSTPTTFNKSGDDLIIASGVYEGTYKITQLTGSELRFEESTTTAAGNVITTYYFNKQ